MFTVAEREQLRAALVAAARADDRIAAAALTGSAASGASRAPAASVTSAGSGTEDEWSDIDLAFGLTPEADLAAVLAEWTARMYRDHGVVHHTDLTRGGTVYRVFLLATTLQVDLAFSPAAEFGADGPSFRLLFGTAQDLEQPAGPAAVNLVGMGWLYALHARSSLARGRVWQAEYMISGLRDQVLALACVRHGVPESQGRGVDRLPAEATAPVVEALVRSLDEAELARAFRAATTALLIEARYADPELAASLTGPLTELAS